MSCWTSVTLMAVHRSSAAFEALRAPHGAAWRPQPSATCEGRRAWAWCAFVIGGGRRTCRSASSTSSVSWLAKGRLGDHIAGEVIVALREPHLAAWLIDLLDDVFPRSWVHTGKLGSSERGISDCCIRCPPLHDYLRVMTVGPLGYNPRDPSELRRYPHFREEAELAERERHVLCHQHRRADEWTEDSMLAAMRADSLVRHSSARWSSGASMPLGSGARCGSIDRLARRHSVCVGTAVARSSCCLDCADSDPSHTGSGSAEHPHCHTLAVSER